MRYFEVKWKEVQSFESLVKAETQEEAAQKVIDGDYEEEPHTGQAPSKMNIVIIGEYEEGGFD